MAEERRRMGTGKVSKGKTHERSKPLVCMTS